MIENELNLLTAAEKKEKIRQRYRGVDPDELEVIPAKPQVDFYDDTEQRRVAVYARVSTDDPRQTSSYELQKNYYEDQVERHPNWTLVDIYADEGITGTSLLHRDAFNRMIADCRSGKIDMIVTKSVSRFARNIVDCISLVRMLAQLKPPVGVFFETEHIFTLKDNTEMSLSFIATMAQEESHTKSAIMNASIEMRFSHGIFLTPTLLGYDHDADGNLVINESEAKTVRLIFFMYLYGYTLQQIADTLTELGCRTKRGNENWQPGSILQILRNERHCGAVLSRKTFTPNYLDHKSRRNNGDRTQHMKPDHHEPIISPEDYLAVQRLISNARYGSGGILPELCVVREGVLRGYVLVNPRWAAFTAEDYIRTSETVPAGQEDEELTFEANYGDFDFRGFEIVRSQFIDTGGKLNVIFEGDQMKFSTACLKKFHDMPYIEILVHPVKMLMAIRPYAAKGRNTVQWTMSGKKGPLMKSIKGSSFLSTMYDLFGWRKDCRYRIAGIYRKQEGGEAIIFDLKDSEVFLPAESTAESRGDAGDYLPSEPLKVRMTPKNTVAGFPGQWASAFGNGYYVHAQAREMAEFEAGQEWKLQEDAQTANGLPPAEYDTSEERAESIRKLIEQIRKEKEGEDGTADTDGEADGGDTAADGGQLCSGCGRGDPDGSGLQL